MTIRSEPLAGFKSLPATPNSVPISPAVAELGKKLFFDPILSENNTISCSSCHKPESNFATHDPVAVGIDDRKGKRNSPTLLNRAYGTSQFWDGRAESLEAQALQPIENVDEMGSTVDAALERISTHADYPALFREAFEDDDNPVNRQNLARSLATFQRTLLIGNSQVDRFRGGEYEALSADARSGMWLFESRANCWRCHSGENFSDEKFHNTGVGHGIASRDNGRFDATSLEDDRFRYKTPTLRGVALTAPYMHDGSVASLEDVVKYYSQGGNTDDPNLDPDIKPLNLTEKEIKQLVAFLKALSE
ncbi:MAG: cytochrome c peroxidase [Pirellulaceae bacterium]